MKMHSSAVTQDGTKVYRMPSTFRSTQGVPHTHTSNPVCERRNPVLEQNLRILMKLELTKGWVRLLP